jgi:hypothetical protein
VGRQAAQTVVAVVRTEEGQAPAVEVMKGAARPAAAKMGAVLLVATSVALAQAVGAGQAPGAELAGAARAAEWVRAPPVAWWAVVLAESSAPAAALAELSASAPAEVSALGGSAAPGRGHPPHQRCAGRSAQRSPGWEPAASCVSGGNEKNQARVPNGAPAPPATAHAVCAGHVPGTVARAQQQTIEMAQLGYKSSHFDGP